MAQKDYANSLNKIKLQLSRYTHLSVFNMALNHLQPPKGASAVSRMPWVSLFLVKQALLQQQGTREITKNEYQRITQNIWNLQNHLVSNDHNRFMLSVRSMINQQTWHQTTPIHILRASLLQRLMLDRSFEYNDQLLKRKVGVGLIEYFAMSDYLFALTSQRAPNEVIKYNLGTFYSHLTPMISSQSISNFINLIAVPFEKLSSFAKDNEIKDQSASEYLQETPFKKKPIILQEDGLVIFNAGLLALGLKDIAFELLKREQGFYDHFGSDVENYIFERLSRPDLEIYREDELKRILAAKNKKISDFAIVENNEIIIIESKAITPSDIMKSAFDPDVLYNDLKKSFLNGIVQGQHTALHMKSSPKFMGKRLRLLIVTLEDFHIYGGEYIDKHFDGRLQREIEADIGEVPIPMTDIIYLTLMDMVHITEWLIGKPKGTLSNFLDDVEKKQSSPHGERITLGHHIDETIRNEVSGAAGIEEISEATSGRMEQIILSNQKFWRQQHPLTFMRAYARFKAMLSE